MRSGNKIIFIFGILGVVLGLIFYVNVIEEDFWKYTSTYSERKGDRQFDYGEFIAVCSVAWCMSVGACYTFGVVFGKGIKKLFKDWANEV